MSEASPEATEATLALQAAAEATPVEDGWQRRRLELGREAELLEGDLSLPRSLGRKQLQEILAWREESERESEAWHESLWGGLGCLRKRVAAVHEKMRPGALDCGGEELRCELQGIEEGLSDFKAQQREDFEALAAEEEATQELLLRLGKRFEGWLGRGTALPLQQRQRPASCPPEQLALSGDSPSCGSTAQAAPEDPELREIRQKLRDLESEVQRSGGALGGWSALQHTVFQRIFLQFKQEASDAFYAKLGKCLNSLPQESLIEHVRWWGEHEQRQAAKRQLLQRFKARRRALAMESAGAAERERAESKAAEQRAQERRKGDSAQTRQKLDAWRKERAVSEERTAALELARSKERQRQEREEERCKQAEQREAVAVFRAQREAQRRAKTAEARAESLEARLSRGLSQEDRQRIAERNMEILRRRLQRAQPQHAQAPSRPSSARGPRRREGGASRLYDSTECSKRKALDRSASETPLRSAGSTARSEWTVEP